MKGYATREVEKVLGLPRSRILYLTRKGVLEPARGKGGAYVFSFRDIVLLRAARDLLDAGVPPRRVAVALGGLRDQLPVGRPLSAVTISAVGDRVVVHDGETAWEPDSGQVSIDFSVRDVVEAVQGFGREATVEGRAERMTADDWFDTAVDLEAVSPEEAVAAYGTAIRLDPTHADAHLNLGRLVHEAGRVTEAEAHYRSAAAADPQSARALYNLGVALEDRGVDAGAQEAYEAALRVDAELPSAHFNLSRILERQGKKAEALRHLAEYRRLLDPEGLGA